jgi:hypothetical protein
VGHGFAEFQKPSEYGYRRMFGKCDQAVKCCMKARDAFIPLMALCSFAISYIPCFTTENPPWIEKLVEVGIHPEWVQSLKTSQLVDFSANNKRVGVIVQPQCVWLYLVPNMVRANVPLWFLWDSPEAISKSPVYTYLPTFEEVREAQMAAQWWEAAKQQVAPGTHYWTPIDDLALVSNNSTLVADGPSQPPLSEQYPKPNPFSGQKRGGTMDDFFARRA